MSVLREIRARGAFREPQFVDLGLAHVPFDTLTDEDGVEGPMLDAVSAGSSAAIVGAPGRREVPRSQEPRSTRSRPR